jgi:hypothetical protein
VKAGNYGLTGLVSETKARHVWFGNNGQRKCVKTYNQQKPPKDADGLWDSKNKAQLPAGWYEGKGNTYYDGNGNIVYQNSEYTKDEYILYENSTDKERKTCYLLNQAQNRRSLDQCVDQAIAEAAKVMKQAANNPSVKLEFPSGCS